MYEPGWTPTEEEEGTWETEYDRGGFVEKVVVDDEGTETMIIHEYSRDRHVSTDGGETWHKERSE